MQELPPTGTLLAGRYRLSDELERHALGGLFVAAYEPFDTRVFLELLRSPHNASRAPGEAAAQPDVGAAETGNELQVCLERAAKLRGLHLCGVIEWFVELGFVCIVFEYAAGVTLRELLDEVGSLPLGQAVEIVHACVEAAGTAYGCGVYYLALDPRNLLITPTGPVKLMRAGYYHVLEASDPWLAREASLYRSPEAVRGLPSRPSDVYAMAVMVREMIGSAPPHRLDAVLRQALNADPAARPAARPFLESLSEAAHAPVRSRSDSHPPPGAIPAGGFPRTGGPAAPGRGGTIRRYLIILAVLLVAAYLAARFIGGCRRPPGGAACMPAIRKSRSAAWVQPYDSSV